MIGRMSLCCNYDKRVWSLQWSKWSELCVLSLGYKSKQLKYNSLHQRIFAERELSLHKMKGRKIWVLWTPLQQPSTYWSDLPFQLWDQIALTRPECSRVGFPIYRIVVRHATKRIWKLSLLISKISSLSSCSGIRRISLPFEVNWWDFTEPTRPPSHKKGRGFLPLTLFEYDLEGLEILVSEFAALPIREIFCRDNECLNGSEDVLAAKRDFFFAGKERPEPAWVLTCVNAENWRNWWICHDFDVFDDGYGDPFEPLNKPGWFNG